MFIFLLRRFNRIKWTAMIPPTTAADQPSAPFGSMPQNSPISSKAPMLNDTTDEQHLSLECLGCIRHNC